ncbi:uncharacterized protein LOC119988849 [Tripterygium wilfordii]|uniref:uncharacterized protein LOC119988849 n=1 Tax=Tripterygium wilfordii TaxID=458696 RepID=UPI0018F81B83|nr:uncharacterized protein LOC119988849 [Tripterygium wilfordii]
MMEDLAEKWDKLTLTGVEELDINLGVEDLDQTSVQGSLSLLGRLHYERSISKEVLSNTLKEIWKLKVHPIFKTLGKNLFAISFENEKDKKRIMEGRPWLFDQHLLVLQEMQSKVPLKEIPFDTELFWVQVHNLPLAAMSEKVGHIIGNSIGECVEVDTQKDGLGWGPFLRIRVRLSLFKPLPRGKKITIPDRTITVGFSYEYLPKFCFKCGCIGHGKGGCSHITSSRLHATEVDMEYGSWMRAQMNQKRQPDINSDFSRRKKSSSGSQKNPMMDEDCRKGTPNIQPSIPCEKDSDEDAASTAQADPPINAINPVIEVVGLPVIKERVEDVMESNSPIYVGDNVKVITGDIVSTEMDPPININLKLNATPNTSVGGESQVDSDVPSTTSPLVQKGKKTNWKRRARRLLETDSEMEGAEDNMLGMKGSGKRLVVDEVVANKKQKINEAEAVEQPRHDQ